MRKRIETDSRQRLRRAFAIFLLVFGIVAGAVWLTRRESDPRFVGRWVVEYDGGTSRMELKDDATGCYFNSQGSVTTVFDWEVRDGLFVMTHRPRDAGFTYWKRRLRQWYYLAIGDASSGSQLRCRFRQSGTDCFDLDFQPHGDQRDVDDYRLVRDTEEDQGYPNR